MSDLETRLCHLHGNVTDLKVALGGIIKEAELALSRCDHFTKRITEIQESHGHLGKSSRVADKIDDYDRDDIGLSPDC